MGPSGLTLHSCLGFLLRVLFTIVSGSPTLQKVWTIKYFSNSVRAALKEQTPSHKASPQAEADSTPGQHSPAPTRLKRHGHQKGREGTEKKVWGPHLTLTKQKGDFTPPRPLSLPESPIRCVVEKVGLPPL